MYGKMPHESHAVYPAAGARVKRVAAAVLAAVLLLSGCAREEKPAEITLMAMDTVMTLRAYGTDNLKDAESTVLALEKKLSVTAEGSEIAALNTAGEGTVSEDTLELLQAALSLCRRTHGALDISIYPVLRCWGFTGQTRQVPDGEALAELLPLVDYERIRMDGSTVSLPHGMMIDLGSVAKGYTGDVLAAGLKSRGVTSACLNLGGNVQTVGGKPDGSPWMVGVQDPQSEDYLGVLALRDQAAVTSGAYQRYFIGEDGKSYGHILDPKTGRQPETDLLSVTVVGSSGVTCDGLSTALYVMGTESAYRFWRASDDFEAVFVKLDGSVAITKGLESQFTLHGKSRELTVIAR